MSDDNFSVWTQEHETAANIVTYRMMSRGEKTEIYRWRYGIELEDVQQMVKVRMARWHMGFPPFHAARCAAKRISSYLAKSHRNRDNPFNVICSDTKMSQCHYDRTDRLLPQVGFDIGNPLDSVVDNRQVLRGGLSVRVNTNCLDAEILGMLIAGHSQREVGRSIGKTHDFVKYRLKKLAAYADTIELSY